MGGIIESAAPLVDSDRMVLHPLGFVVQPVVDY